VANNNDLKYGKIASMRRDPIEADTLVLVNSVLPAVPTRTSENTLMLFSPNTYRTLLAETKALILLCSVSSWRLMLPAETVM